MYLIDSVLPIDKLSFFILPLLLLMLLGCSEERNQITDDQEATPERSTPSATAPRTPTELVQVSSPVATKATPEESPPVVATPHQDSSASVVAPLTTTVTPLATRDGDADSIAVTATPTPMTQSEPTATIKPLHTPKARSEWRAMGGEFFVHFQGGIKIFEYYLTVPPNWGGIFEMQQEEEDAIIFFYTPDQQLKVEIFRLTALREDIWQQKKAAGEAGNQIFEQRGAVFVLHVAKENPFDSEQPEAETFQTMLEDVPVLIAETLEIISRRE